jgi:acyl carrier protein
MENQELLVAARSAAALIAKKKVGDDEPLVSSGLIDSLSVLRLIQELESRLHIRIPTELVQPDDFDTVNIILETIDRTVARK